MLYLCIHTFLQHHHRYQFPPGTAAEQAEKRLLYIPALFLLLRIWGTAQLFYSIGVSSLVEEPGCIPHGIQIVFVVFGILQVSISYMWVFIGMNIVASSIFIHFYSTDEVILLSFCGYYMWLLVA